mmetsp:Transcript_38496/g.85718  ORF Transcript_38496/g.85718 Transcript_38496/m.85718 type:complete len:274 (-) Transcript_38496:31-852(-)
MSTLSRSVIHQLRNLYHQHLAAQTQGLQRFSSAGSEVDGPSTSAPSSPSLANEQPIYAACVLERLPVVMPTPPDQDLADEAWLRQRNIAARVYKEYPQKVKQSAGTGGDSATSAPKPDDKDLRPFSPAPLRTPADESGDIRTMRRALDRHLYLLVRTHQAAGSSAPSPWSFPMVQVNRGGGESLSDAGKRAAYGAVGRAHPLYFVGNAPMAHLPLLPAGGSVFFMLAQVVGEPWSMKLVPGTGAADHAWVTREEIGGLVNDPRLQELVSRMLM